jgi:hypothetical protein
MAENKKEIELRSEKVRNIVGQIPPVLLRRGITIISLVLLVLLVSAYFVPYPETVHFDIALQSREDTEIIRGAGYCSPLIKSKLKEGQMVNMELLGYPSTLFGLVEGRISTISPISETNTSGEPVFKIEILFPGELQTSYHQTIPYYPQMQGTGTVLLSNEPILKRFILSIFNIEI